MLKQLFIICVILYRIIYPTGFQDHQAVLTELDLVEEDDQITHLLRLDDDGATEDVLSALFDIKFTFIAKLTRRP